MRRLRRLAFKGTLAALFAVHLANPLSAQTTWQGGTGNWGSGINWSAGVPNSLTNAFIDDGNGVNSIVNVNVAASVNDLTIDLGDAVNINNALRLSIHGTLFNDGTVTVNSTGSFTYLQPVGTTTFSGSGVVEMSGANAYLYDNNNPNAASDHLINGSTHTIRGMGNVGFGNTLQITNQGIIDANVSGATLNVTPNDSGMINTGTMRATNGGNLNLVGTSLGSSVINNTNAIIEAGAGSTVTHNTSTRGIVGGQLTGDGTHLVGASNARFDSLTVEALVDVLNARRLDLLGTIVNNNLIRVSSTGSFTYLQPVGMTTLAGTGAVELIGSNAYLYDSSDTNAASDHLINGASHTIRGFGNVGFGSTLQITNQGLIDANVSGETLSVTPNGLGMINTGIMRATNGGNLNLIGTSLGSSVINNTNAIIEAGAGSTVTHNTSTRGILGGILTGDGTHLVGASNARFDSLTVEALVDVLNARRLDLLGTIVNNNLIRVSSTGSFTYLQPVGTTTLAGTGAVELIGSNAYLYDNSDTNAASDHLINGASHTIRGFGNIGFGSTLQITNHGLIDANVSGETLNITPNASGMVNSELTGIMRATNGGNLNLIGTSLGSSVINNTNAIIEAGAGSTVTHNTSTRGILGGILTGDGTHLVGASHARFDSLTVEALVDIPNARRLDLLGTIVNNNLIRVSSTGSFTYLQPVGTTTLAGTGAVELIGSNAYLYDNSDTNAASDHLINGASHTIRGFGNIGFGSTLQITNHGLIDANVSGETLNVSPNAFGLDNFGTLRASNGSTLLLLGSNHGGTGIFEALDGSQLRVGASTVANNVSAGGVLTDGTWRAIDAGAGATLRILNNSTALIDTIGADAEVELSGANSVFTVRSTNVALDSTLNNVQGNLTLRNDRAMLLGSDLSNSGNILVDGPGTSLGVSGNFSQTAGTLLLAANATLQLSGSSNTVTGGLVGGNGTIVGDLDNVSGLLSPGLSPGMFGITGNYQQGAPAAFEVEIGGLLQGIDFDYLNVGGNALLDGNLLVGLYGGFTPDATDTFTILTGNAVSGVFANALTQVNVIGGGIFDVTYTTNSVILGNYVVPEPSSAALILIAGLRAIFLRRRKI